MDLRDLLYGAYVLSEQSPDQSTQNGSLIVDDDGTVLAFGCNRFPDRVEDKEERWERPIKYKFAEHAERNSIYDAANKGISTKGKIMICPWAACSDCARAIIQSGIKKLVTHQEAHDRSPSRWVEEIETAFTMLNEADIEVVMFSGDVCEGNVPLKLRHSGEVWTP